MQEILYLLMTLSMAAAPPPSIPDKPRTEKTDCDRKDVAKPLCKPAKSI